MDWGSSNVEMQRELAFQSASISTGKGEITGSGKAIDENFPMIHG
jgi:hypothetical protein